MAKFADDVGDGASATVTVAHNLGTTDVVVEAYRNGDPWDTVIVEPRRPTDDTIELVFREAPDVDAYRVVVLG